MLCEPCFAFATRVYEDPGFEAPFDDDYEPTLIHPSFTAFREAARSGCQFCVHTWNDLLRDVPLDQERLSDDTAVPVLQVRCRHSADGDARELTHVWFIMTQLEGFAEWANDVLSPFRQSNLEYNPNRISVAFFTKQPKTFESCTTKEDFYGVLIKQIRLWLEADRQSPTAIEDHLSEAASFCPTRLVQISDDGQTISLVDGARLPAETEYVALSHRWTYGDNSIKCIESTLDTLQAGIPVTRLNMTLQEAVSITSDMGFSLIWIDCLCIVQDNREDWKRESRTMQNVYSNAECTIAANNSSRDPAASFLEPVLESFRKRTMARQFPFTTSFISPHELIYLAPLSARGWCLQERLLSKRIIHFLGSDVAFESSIRVDKHSRTIPTAMIPSGQGERGINLPTRNFTEGSLGVSVPGPVVTPGVGIYYDITTGVLYHWLRIVEDFKKRHLTHESDRLVAINAIVSMVSKKTGWTYYHGLWMEAIATCLLWYADNAIHFLRDTAGTPGADKLEPLSGIHFPSWSWAACRNMIRNEYSNFANSEILISTLPLEGGAKPTLQIYGNLLPIDPGPGTVDSTVGIHDPKSMLLAMPAQWYLEQFLPAPSSTSADLEPFQVPERSLLYLMPDSRLFDPTRIALYYLPVLTGLDSHHCVNSEDATEVNNQLHITGLVVQRSANAPTEYARVGQAWFNTSLKEFDPAPLTKMGERVRSRSLENGVSFTLV